METDFWRRPVTKETVRGIMDKNQTIIEEIQQKQLYWYSHIQTISDHRTTWTSGIKKAMSDRNLRPGDFDAFEIKKVMSEETCVHLTLTKDDK